MRLKNLGIMSVVPWSMKIAVTRSIFEIQGTSLGFISLFIGSKYLATPSEGGGVKIRNLNFAKNFIFEIQDKSKSFRTVCVPV